MDQKPELTAEQISVLLQIINKTNFMGEQIEFVTELKRTLMEMMRVKQNI